MSFVDRHHAPVKRTVMRGTERYAVGRIEPFVSGRCVPRTNVPGHEEHPVVTPLVRSESATRATCAVVREYTRAKQRLPDPNCRFHMTLSSRFSQNGTGGRLKLVVDDPLRVRCQFVEHNPHLGPDESKHSSREQ